MTFWGRLAGSKGRDWAGTRKVCSGSFPVPWGVLAAQTQDVPGHGAPGTAASLPLSRLAGSLCQS